VEFRANASQYIQAFLYFDAGEWNICPEIIVNAGCNAGYETLEQQVVRYGNAILPFIRRGKTGYEIV
jgi:hypothetical protein